MKNFTGQILCFLIFVFSPIAITAQVGIGTTSPTQQLDINGDTRVRGLANALGKTLAISALPDGTLVTNNNINALGIKFVGFLSSDVALNTQAGLKNIILSNELIDVQNEYTPATGYYNPVIDGYYKISMDFDIGNYTNDLYDLEVLIGLWDYTTNAWVSRRTFRHRDLNTLGVLDGRSESHGITNYLQLIAGHNYGFRIAATYDTRVAAALYNAVLKYQNTGSTGPSLSTSFAIEKIL